MLIIEIESLFLPLSKGGKSKSARFLSISFLIEVGIPSLIGVITFCFNTAVLVVDLRGFSDGGGNCISSSFKNVIELTIFGVSVTDNLLLSIFSGWIFSDTIELRFEDVICDNLGLLITEMLFGVDKLAANFLSDVIFFKIIVLCIGVLIAFTELRWDEIDFLGGEFGIELIVDAIN